MTGTKPQLYNGIALIATFFSCRLVWGTYQSFLVARDIWTGLHNEPTVLSLTTPLHDGHNATLPTQYSSTMQYVTASTGVPWWLAAIYVGSNMTLNSLNFYWFFKMIDAVRKRFDPKGKDAPPKEEPAEIKDVDETKGVTTGVDGSAAEFKLRPRRGTLDALLDGEETETPPPT